MIPVILGPGDNRYVIDHHHLVRALHEEGVVNVLHDGRSGISASSTSMPFGSISTIAAGCTPSTTRGWRDYGDLPKAISDLVDDPFRSLAGALRRAGGFAKDTTPFSEYPWADFLRRRIKRRAVKDQSDGALKKALLLAKGHEASYLPGWCGPVDN